MDIYSKKITDVGFVGLGLIGGSIARAVRLKRPDIRITAYNRNAAVLDEALSDGIIDEKADESLGAFSKCSLVIVCVPVVTAVGFLKRLIPVCGPDTVFSDVGSVKGDICREAEKLGLAGRFIGGHPMAGSEKTGYAASNARLIENAWYLLTPLEGVPESATKAMAELVRDIGALPLVMSPEKHDAVTAAVSHLPHIVSASLVNLVHDLDGEDRTMKTVAAGGFRDITRISSSSPQMWQEICLANSESIIKALDAYTEKLKAFRGAIERRDGEALLDSFTECKLYRDSFSEREKGSLPKEHRIYVQVADEAGAIAGVAALLAERGISIKNIGIVHNREFEEGVLRILLYSEESRDAGVKALIDSGWHVAGGEKK